MTNNSSNNQNNLTIVKASGSNPTNKNLSACNIVSTNPSEYFSSAGIGSYIDLHLEEEAEFNTIVLGFYRGKERKTKFTVAKADDDFDSFEPTEPHCFVSSGETNDPQKFHIKKVKAKGVRISFDGNIDNSNFVSKGVINPLFINQSASVYTQDVGPNQQIFSLTSASLLLEDLDEQQNEKLDKILEEIKELERSSDHQCKDGKCKCCRCGGDLDKGVCKQCGRTGDYNHVTYNYVTENFPVTYDITNNKFVNVQKNEYNIDHNKVETVTKNNTAIEVNNKNKEDIENNTKIVNKDNEFKEKNTGPLPPGLVKDLENKDLKSNKVVAAADNNKDSTLTLKGETNINLEKKGEGSSSIKDIPENTIVNDKDKSSLITSKQAKKQQQQNK